MTFYWTPGVKGLQDGKMFSTKFQKSDNKNNK